MAIYVVNPGDNIFTIAAKFNVTVTKVMQDNELQNPTDLVPGQTIVITYPKQVYTVQQGDTITSIANAYGVSIMQLLRNNSFLSEREYIYPGETLAISYNVGQEVTINGYAYPYINRNTLIRTLPYLTYISIFNYQVAKAGEIITLSNDSEVVQIAKEYGTVPLMMLSSLSPKGEPNTQVIYELFINKEYHAILIKNLLQILKSSSYLGVNIMISELNTTTQMLQIDLLTKISDSLKKEGYFVFLTINPNIININDKVLFEQLDYSRISQLVDGITFLQYVWGANYGPPSPVISIYSIREFIEYMVSIAPPDKISVGKPLIGYDWVLPYIAGSSYATSLTLDSIILLAHDIGATIQFDEKSQTPYFQYIQYGIGSSDAHIVWFIDARSIDALDNLIDEFNLSGSGIWNIMIFNQQMWSLINSQYNIIKVILDNLH